jgi:hypothetical protein
VLSEGLPVASVICLDNVCCGTARGLITIRERAASTTEGIHDSRQSNMRKPAFLQCGQLQTYLVVYEAFVKIHVWSMLFPEARETYIVHPMMPFALISHMDPVQGGLITLGRRFLGHDIPGRCCWLARRTV